MFHLESRWNGTNAFLSSTSCFARLYAEELEEFLALDLQSAFDAPPSKDLCRSTDALMAEVSSKLY